MGFNQGKFMGVDFTNKNLNLYRLVESVYKFYKHVYTIPISSPGQGKTCRPFGHQARPSFSPLFGSTQVV